MNKSDFKMDLALFTHLLNFFSQELYIYGAFYGVMFECCLSQGALNLGLRFLLVPLIYISETFKLLDVAFGGKKGRCVFMNGGGERGRHLLPFTRGQLTVGAMTPCQLPRQASVIHLFCIAT